MWENFPSVLECEGRNIEAFKMFFCVVCRMDFCIHRDLLRPKICFNLQVESPLKIHKMTSHPSPAYYYLTYYSRHNIIQAIWMLPLMLLMIMFEFVLCFLIQWRNLIFLKRERAEIFIQLLWLVFKSVFVVRRWLEIKIVCNFREDVKISFFRNYYKNLSLI